MLITSEDIRHVDNASIHSNPPTMIKNRFSGGFVTYGVY